jgi:hypothetical protein
MKTKPISMIIMLTFLLIGCEKEESIDDVTIDTSSISFTECTTNSKSTDKDTPSIRLIGQSDGKLIVKMINTEFCCGTDSVSIDKSFIENKIGIEIIDNGPFTWCYCPHALEFDLKSLENKEYLITLIESEHSYSRDTFLIRFMYSEQLDTTVTGINSEKTIDDYPLTYVQTDLGGCNNISKSVQPDNEEGADTLIFNEQAGSIKIFAGLNLTCCIDFSSESESVGDTLIMKLNTLNDDFCDCICYYTFDYIYDNYSGQGFYYRYYIDDYKRFEGKYNLP